MPHNLLALCSIAAISMVVITSYLFYRGYQMGSNIELSLMIQPHNKKGMIKTSLRSSTKKDGEIGDKYDKPATAEKVAATLGIPSCARDVFLTLESNGDNKNAQGCNGLLIRDDIIVTSSECSKSSFTFDFAGIGVLEAEPHPTLNSHERMVNSRLGFLEANPPYHHYFIDQPVRRTRMFLSLSSGHPTTDNDGTAEIITCNGRKPIAHNLLVNGEMVPIGELMGIVPDDILWEHTDIYTAPELCYHHDRWWTKQISRREEEDTFRQMLDEYRGPVGSISIPAAHDDFVMRASALCEAVDPRGHRRDQCFKNYYIRWREQKPFSGMHFFDWLDFGDGKFLFEHNREKHFLPYLMDKDERCDKVYFNRFKVHYFGDARRAFHEAYIAPSEDGTQLIARYKVNDEPVPESHMDDPHLYMWDLDKKLYIVDHRFDKERFGIVKHTGVLAGMPALSAGKAYFGKKGAIWGINYSSGHYRPGIEAATMMYSWMKDSQGFNATAIHWVGRKTWSTDDCTETDWESIEIPGYNDVEALDRACRELTQGPTWILKDDV